MTIAYVYKWTHLPTLKWYVGSHGRKGCHPDSGYICTQEYVKNAVKWYPLEWKRDIIATGTKEDMKLLENMILQLFDAKGDHRSFNQSNNDGRYGGTGRPLGYKVSAEAKANYLKANREKAKDPAICAKLSKPHSKEWSEKISKSLKGKTKSKEHIEKQRESLKQYWANKKLQAQT